MIQLQRDGKCGPEVAYCVFCPFNYNNIFSSSCGMVTKGRQGSAGPQVLDNFKSKFYLNTPTCV